MKLSTKFVKEYIDIEVDTKTLAEDMTNVGNEYDSIEGLISGTSLVVGEVKTCVDHPDSDHLHVCTVDVGDEILNIVCGAPNVREGLKVIVAKAGAVLPEIVIKKGNIRGQESNGMLCSMAELGLEAKYLEEADKTGIHELPGDAIIGKEVISYLEMDDETIDFELTANRGDLLSILGMAYEIGAIYDKKIKDIDLSFSENGNDFSSEFEVKVNTNLCDIFLAKKVKDLEIIESPKFIKNRLMASGIRPINNVVDISNYVMLETGQPLHFYDADKIGNVLEVREAKKQEELVTLDGITRKLKETDLVITDGENAIGLAGVMGGLDTEVTENTKNIVIEAAIFDGVQVRKTSKEILRSEASTRFEKGLDPNRTYMAISRACHLLEKYAKGNVQTGIAKVDNADLNDTKIEITIENINRILGMQISSNEILEVFRKLDFKASLNEEKIEVIVPKRRLDITIKEDLIEEVGRIYGVNNIKGKMPKLAPKEGSYDKVTRNIRNKMIDLGLNETLSYILVGQNQAKMFTNNDLEVVKLLDPMSEDRNTLRNSILPSLLKIYEYNKARNVKDVSIFEIGKSFFKKDETYGEENTIGALMAGEYFLEVGNKKQVDFYVLKGIVEELLDYLGYSGRYSFTAENLPNEIHPGQGANINVNGEILGVIGKVHPEVLKDNVFVFEISLDKLLNKKVGKMKYKEISKFPVIKKDLSLVIKNDTTSKEVEMIIKKAAGSLMSNIEVFDVYTGKGVEEEYRSVSYSLTFEKQDRTLTDEEVNTCIEKIIEFASKKIGAEIRK